MQPAATRTLSTGTKVAFGVGQMAEGIKNAAFGIFVLYYYNQVLELSGTLSGLALGIAIVCDAITDPVAGSLSDKLRSRWGRRHPFILGSALPLAVTFYLLFSPPEGLGQTGLFVWLTVFAVLVRSAMTAYHIPHLALGAEMAHDYNERSSVFAYSTIFGFMGAISTGFVAYSVFFAETPEFTSGLLNPQGYPRFALTFGIAMVAAIVVCVWGTRKEIPYLPVASPDAPPFSPLNLVRELSLVFRQRSFLTIFFALLLGTIVLAVEGVFSTYMSVHFWGFRTDQIRFIGLGAVLGLPLSLILTPLLTKRFDKRNAIVICAAIAIVNANIPVCMRLLGIEVLPDNGTTALLFVLIAASFVGGAVGPVIFATINSVFADICDEIELERGQRVEGLVYAARAFALKATSGLGAMIGGIILDLIQFPTNAQPGLVDADVIFRLGVAQGPATSIFTMLSLLLYAQYKLDRRRHAEIMAALQERRGDRPTAASSAAG